MISFLIKLYECMNIITYVVNFNADTIDKNTSDALIVVHAYDSIVKRGR